MYNICCTKVVYVVSFILYKVGNSKFIVPQYTNYVLSEVTPRAIVGIELNNELAITQISIYKCIYIYIYIINNIQLR